ncbi:MAG: serine hydrolase [Firmicutes bacterium]|nr:serine hydrolase [Candidatus Fermentithermobacillaceae bacterium]
MSDCIKTRGLFQGKEGELLDLLRPAGGEWGIVIDDLDGKGFLELNGNKKFLAASVIKIPIMMAAFDQVRHGRSRLDDTIVLKREDKVGGSGVLLELHNGLCLTLLDAIHLMIVVSDNTATNLVIDSIGGIDVVNQYMARRGLKDSRLENYLMKPKPQGPRNTVTPSEVAYLLRGIATRSIDNPGDCDTMYEILKRQQYNEKIPWDLPPGVECAHKTGEIQGVTHDAGIVRGPGVNFVIVCLSQNLPSTRVGDRTIGQVAKWAYDILAGNSQA